MSSLPFEQQEIEYNGVSIPNGGPPREGSLVGEDELDRFFGHVQLGKSASNDDGSLLKEDSKGLMDDGDDDYDESGDGPSFYQSSRRLLDRDASIIPGSPFSKPPVVATNRPKDALPVARIINTATLLLTCGAVAWLLYVSIISYESATRKGFECFLSIIAFFGLYWSFRSLLSSFFSMFLSARAFQTNTKFCSIVPEAKLTHSPWLDVTIQIPVSSEPLKEVLLPTMKSFVRARDHYVKESGARCNIVICDDHLMVLLRDNFATAEMLWNEIVRTRGQLFHLGTVIRGLPRPVRQHLKGLSSRSVHEAFYRMLFYYHHRIGFSARAFYDRKGNSQKEANLNSHLRLVLGAQQLLEEENDMTIMDAMLHESHNEDGSRFIMFGNNVDELGELVVVGGSDMRISENLLLQTVPEFMNDPKLAFTQHAVRAKPRQRQESYFTRMMATYYDFLYRGHYLFSAVMGCPPPLTIQAIMIRTAALRQTGKVRLLRKTQRWLQNIGIEFLPVDQVGFGNLSKTRRVEYWAEDKIWGGFEAMIELYNLGFDGRYCLYPDCDFQVGIPRTFDEFSAKQRRDSMGAHEVVFNAIPDMIGGSFVFSHLFKVLIKSNIPSYYKGYLVSVLFSYLTGGTFFFCFIIGSIIRILFDVPQSVSESDLRYLSFSASSAIAGMYVLAFALGNVFFLMSTLRLRLINRALLAESRRWCCSTLGDLIRYNIFQILVEPVSASAFSFLGAMDHLFLRSATKTLRNRFQSYRRRCPSFGVTVAWNIGSWYLGVVVAGLAYATVVRSTDWNPTTIPADTLRHAVFAGPAILLAWDIWVSPLLLNPYIWGWPFVWQQRKTNGGGEGYDHSNSNSAQEANVTNDPEGGVEVSHKNIASFVQASKELDKRIGGLNARPDVEIVSQDLRTTASNSIEQKFVGNRRRRPPPPQDTHQQWKRSEGSDVDRFGFPVS